MKLPKDKFCSKSPQPRAHTLGGVQAVSMWLSQAASLVMPSVLKLSSYDNSVALVEI